jgi:hypothetical protein
MSPVAVGHLRLGALVPTATVTLMRPFGTTEPLCRTLHLSTTSSVRHVSVRARLIKHHSRECAATVTFPGTARVVTRGGTAAPAIRPRTAPPAKPEHRAIRTPQEPG